MNRFRIDFEREKCLGDAICTAICSNWYMDSDGKASYRNNEIGQEDYEENHEAEISCPAEIIKIRKI